MIVDNDVPERPAPTLQEFGWYLMSVSPAQRRRFLDRYPAARQALDLVAAEAMEEHQAAAATLQ